MGDPTRPRISAIVTSYYEEATLEEFHEKLTEGLRATGESYEIIMVNDGSTDATFEKMKLLYERDEHIVCVMDFFKNAGQLAAWTAAIQESRGEVVLLIDSDLQMDPTELPRLYDEYCKGYDLISGYRENRQDSLSRVIPSRIANMIMRKVSGSTLRDFGCTFKLYDARLLRGLELGPYKTFNTPLVVAQVQRYSEVPITHFPRRHGKSGWTFTKLWQYNMDNLVNLTKRPFQIVMALCLLLAGLLTARVLLYPFFPYDVLDEVTNGLLLHATVISLLITTAILCMIGEFAIRSFNMSLRMPAYIVREIHDRRHAPQASSTSR